MRPLLVLAGTLGAAAAALAARERRRRLAAERFMAAALETLLDAVDANDPQTGAHARRVACYAIALAEAAGLDDTHVRRVERIALFHDIGKIDQALFDIVHDNEDELTEAERAAIATHPDRGAQVLSPLSAFYPDLAEGVRSHHERWDGTGYPRGLSGERIPLAARIVAIADTFDAMTHERRYSPAKSPHEAADVVRRGAGALFDPRLADLFVSAEFFPRIERAFAGFRRPAPEPARRRRTGEREHVPDVTFRWRDEARARPLEDRPNRTPPG
jgi:putative two-component system response regulator